MRTTSQIFIDAKGLFWHIKWKSFFEAIINLSFALYFLLVLNWGMESVVIATIISNLSTNIWWEPFVVFKYGFEKKVLAYYIKFLNYTITLGVSYLITCYLQSFFSNGYKDFIIKCIIAILIPNVILVVIFSKTEEFSYFMSLIKNIFSKKYD
jgi:hypothetical protein